LPATAPTPEPYLATHVRTEYATRDDEKHYIVDRVARTTTFEIVNDGRDALPRLHEQIAANELDSGRAIVAQTRTFYDGEAFRGLPLGQVGDFGAPVR